MLKSLKGLTIAGLTTAMVAVSFIPSQAMPVVKAPVAASSQGGNIVDVDYRRPPPPHYRGYRGYHNHRPGYRYHNGYWFPLAAFATGAVIGGAIASQPAPRAAGINPRHYQWCEARYRSYDARSNTFQPYNGPRQTCVSPYY